VIVHFNFFVVTFILFVYAKLPFWADKEEHILDMERVPPPKPLSLTYPPFNHQWLSFFGLATVIFPVEQSAAEHHVGAVNYWF